MKVGDKGVGKTAFIVRLLTNRFIGHYAGYRYDHYNHKLIFSDRLELFKWFWKFDNFQIRNDVQCKVNGKSHQYNILDLSTVHPMNEAKFDSQVKWGEIFFLVYSITDRESFKEITRLAFLVKFIHKMSKVKPRLILLGSKLDLYQHRQVDHAEGKFNFSFIRTLV